MPPAIPLDMNINEANATLAALTLSDIRSAICGYEHNTLTETQCGCARCRQAQARRVLTADLPKVDIDSITLVF